jgi:glyoxylase-like metal-dependent hydrolase (beta-lactamase superfamily II)
MKPPEVAEGVHRLGTAWANCSLVRDGALSTLVDAGYPRYFKQLTSALAALGSSLEAVSGAIVTHHHVDHVGTAEAARSRSGARVFVHDRPSRPGSADYGSTASARTARVRSPRLIRSQPSTPTLLFGHGDPWRGLARAPDVAGATDDHPGREPRTP